MTNINVRSQLQYAAWGSIVVMFDAIYRRREYFNSGAEYIRSDDPRYIHIKWFEGAAEAACIIAMKLLLLDAAIHGETSG